MTILEKDGNLFDIDYKYALAHCISEDCEMGKGIARQFVHEFPYMKRYVYDMVHVNNIHYPCAIVYPFSLQKVINIITKDRYFDLPTYDSIRKGIKHAASICESLNIKYLAMPRIGCGKDGLNWNTVKEIIIDEFENLDIEIIIINWRKIK